MSVGLRVLSLSALLLTYDSDQFLDISIRLDHRSDAKLSLEVSADVKRVYDMKKSREGIAHRNSKEKMYVYGGAHYSNTDVCDSPCYKTNEILVQLYENRRKNRGGNDKVEVCSRKVSLLDDVLYTENTYTSE